VRLTDVGRLLPNTDAGTVTLGVDADRDTASENSVPVWELGESPALRSSSTPCECRCELLLPLER
jgi:hypothetical protein